MTSVTHVFILIKYDIVPAIHQLDERGDYPIGNRSYSGWYDYSWNEKLIKRVNPEFFNHDNVIHRNVSVFDADFILSMYYSCG